MKVLMISGDKNVLHPESEAGKRLLLQRAQVDRLDVLVWRHIHSFRDVLKATAHTAYDVITAQDPFWRGLLAWRAARKSKSRLNLQVHTDLSAQPIMRRLLAYMLLRRAHSVRVVSEKIKDQVQKTGTRATIHVLPIHLDLARFQNLERLPHERPTILWVGRFEKEKDPLLAIEVLKQVRARGIEAVLVMLGAGKLEAALRRAAKNLPVEFPGWKPPEAYLNMADVVLCTSQHESWGASIIEALAAGVPVVAPDVGIAREAGAIVVGRSNLAEGIVTVLQEKPKGVLRIALLDNEEWAKRWKETLA